MSFLLTPASKKSRSGRRWENFSRGNFKPNRFSLQKFLDVKTPDIKSSETCKKCAYTRHIIDNMAGLINAEWDGPGEECSSNYFTRTIVLSDDSVLIRTTSNTYDGWSYEYDKISIKDFIYHITHHPDNLFRTVTTRHKSVDFNIVKELEPNSILNFITMG